jgi:ribosomal protein S18 acetylase RimI-like enzyme
MAVVEPSREQVLAFCAQQPVERVFLEDVARRGLGRFLALENGDGGLSALCHAGANIVPSGPGSAAFAAAAAEARSRMIIGEREAVSELWESARGLLPAPREDRPRMPVYSIAEPPPPGETGLRPAVHDDVERLLPACAAAHALELGIDPLAADAEGFRWRTEAQIKAGRSWLWLEDDVVLFKAEASAWTPQAVQVQQVWVDPAARGRGCGGRGMRDLVRLLLRTTPVVTLFVRSENEAAIATYASIGMEQVLEYRSILF